jgi:bis(5'-nucleosyl)-tetraphosphatase (symmetrical)
VENALMIYFIGDVQGCVEPLQRLLLNIGFSPSRDRVVLLGDLVNRGPASLAVLKLAASLGNAATCLLGNHDLHLLAVAHGARAVQANDTFTDVLGASDAASWIEWLRHQPLAHTEAGWLCVHAGVVPQWSVDTTLALAAEVQSQLRASNAGAFFRTMYGNEPKRWKALLMQPEHTEARLRFTINVLTRIRFCDALGKLDFKTKEGAGAAPEGYLPWFDAPGRLTAEQPIAFGHWSTLGLINLPKLLALDTGCVWGGSLTAVRVDGGRREVVQVPCEQAQKPGS